MAKYVSETKPYPDEEELEQGLERAKKIRQHQPRPQFPHSDYMGMMLDLAKALDLPIQLPSSYPLVLPAFFSSNAEIREQVSDSVTKDIEKYKKGNGVAKAIAYALEGGKWKMYRELFEKSTNRINVVEGYLEMHRIRKPVPVDHLPTSSSSAQSCSSASGTCLVGEDSPTIPANLSSQDLLINPFLWYHETGHLVLANGMKLDVSQSYVYRYNEETETLDVYFSKVTSPQEIDRPFLRLRFECVEGEGWIAKAYHLCGEDHYHASYLLSFAGLNIAKMEIIFDVLGPQKNYRSTTTFTMV